MEAGLKHELYWEIYGAGGDTLSVKTLYDGVENTILNKAKIPSGKSHLENLSIVACNSFLLAEGRLRWPPFSRDELSGLFWA
jgi:hypothetical protein